MTKKITQAIPDVNEKIAEVYEFSTSRKLLNTVTQMKGHEFFSFIYLTF